jgi:hypothetical protein
VNLQLAAELADAFSHTAYADSQHGCLFVSEALRLLGCWPSLVLDLQGHTVITGCNRHVRNLTARVAMDVVEAFLQDSEQRNLDILVHPRQPRGEIQIDFDLASAGEPVDIPAGRGAQAYLIE